eukprot:Gb_15542 [translate_table: standard]
MQKTMWRAVLKPLQLASSSVFQIRVGSSSSFQRAMHSRNKKAMEFIAKGWSAIQEVDRVIDHTEPDDELLTPLLKGAKKNFELALEVDNLNTHARLWLARLHLKYCVPGACKAVAVVIMPTKFLLFVLENASSSGIIFGLSFVCHKVIPYELS